MRPIYMIAADVLRALGWEVEINEKENYWNLVLTNTTSSEDMPESHKSCLRGLLRGWLMEFNYEGSRQQVNIYKELHGLDPEDDRYSCLDTCANRTDSNTPQYKLDDKEIFVRRKDRFARYVLEEPVSENITTELSTEQEAASRANGGVMLDDELDSHKPKDKNYERANLLCNLLQTICEAANGVEEMETDAGTTRILSFRYEPTIEFYEDDVRIIKELAEEIGEEFPYIIEEQ